MPFSEPAYILVFKSDLSEWSDEKFWQYLRTLAIRLEEENTDGTPYRLSELPPDHPARQYARRVNPDFEATLPASGPAR